MILGIRHVFASLAMIAIATVSSAASAEVSKEACIESHSRAQDAREQGKLSLARKLFMTCAQPACPALVQNDCARYADDIERYQPFLTFAARDSQGNDLPDTTVYLDGVLVVTRLDDGKPHEVDPGRHVVRFEYGGRQETVTVVVGSGEKVRAVVGTFATEASSSVGQSTREEETEEEESTHALGSRIMLGASAAMLVGGATLGIVGLMKVPDQCSTSTHECKAPPGDPAFDQAVSAVRLSNIGWSLSGAGLAAMAIGLVWYFKSEGPERDDTMISPLITPETAGLAISGRL